MSSVVSRRWRFFGCKAGFRPRSLRVFTAIPMVSNGLSKRVTYAIDKVWSTGWNRIFSMARDGTRRSFSKKPGFMQRRMTKKDWSTFRNWPPPFAGHRSSRSNHRSPLRHASRYSKRYGRIPRLDLLAEILHEGQIAPAIAVVLGVRLAGEGAPFSVALPAFLQSYVANLVTAGVRLIPLGQTDGQRAVAELEHVIEAASAQAAASTIDDLGSAAFMVDLASMAHETQYTRLFRS
jgi:urease accessory protein UreF